jgi:hypothetical protein
MARRYGRRPRPNNGNNTYLRRACAYFQPSSRISRIATMMNTPSRA